MSWDVHGHDGAIVVTICRRGHVFGVSREQANLIAPTVNRINSSAEGIDSAALHALMQPDAQRAQAAALARLQDKSRS